MRISTRVKPNAGIEDIERLGDKEFLIRVKAPAKENKANEAAVAVLARFFGVSKANIKLVSGSTSRNKIFDVEI
ncbi:MAG: DUF167 domain-containing protein [Actinobacteria bacterium]|nr:DUF167 domain-containing protein [Actinomycetota bacterium]